MMVGFDPRHEAQKHSLVGQVEQLPPPVSRIAAALRQLLRLEQIDNLNDRPCIQEQLIRDPFLGHAGIGTDQDECAHIAGRRFAFRSV